jgi:hypothetical protein
MSGSNGYPIAMYHPGGHKTMWAYDAADQKAIQRSFQEWSADHEKWNQKALAEQSNAPVVPFSGTPLPQGAGNKTNVR